MKIKRTAEGGYSLTIEKDLLKDQVINATVAVASVVVAFEAFWYGVA